MLQPDKSGEVHPATSDTHWIMQRMVMGLLPCVQQLPVVSAVLQGLVQSV
jgi:hypothetical protein